MQGSWTAEKGELDFTVRNTQGSSEFGWTWNPRAPNPAGGVIVVKSGDRYGVMLISSGGTRVAATKATTQGALLRVQVGSGLFYLSETSSNRLQLLHADDNGKPVTSGAGVIDLRPGSFPPAATSVAPSPTSP